MNLQDMESACLADLQNTNPPPNFGSPPAWGAFTNPSYPQSLVDFQLNQGYAQLLTDLSDIELALCTVTFSSSANATQYPIPSVVGVAPGTPCPAIAQVAHVSYQPVGLSYSQEFDPGTYFVSWSEFQRITGQGYLRPFSFGTQPSWCTITPDRQNMAFYPGSANNLDVITYSYIPIPTLGAVAAMYSPAAPGIVSSSTGCPTLIGPLDTPITPPDTHLAIVYWALARLWMKGREAAVSASYTTLYETELRKIRERYTTRSRGDTFRVKPFVDQLGVERLL